MLRRPFAQLGETALFADPESTEAMATSRLAREELCGGLLRVDDPMDAREPRGRRGASPLPPRRVQASASSALALAVTASSFMPSLGSVPADIRLRQLHQLVHLGRKAVTR